jgi:hypothetical protein
MPVTPDEIDEPIIIQSTTAASLGELLTPLLLLVGEVCVGYAVLLSLAITLGFAGENYPIVPFWGLLSIMAIFYIMATLFHRGRNVWLRNILEPLSWVLVCAGFALFFVWYNNYAQSTTLFSIDWLLAAFHTFIPVSTMSAQMVADAIQVNIAPAVQIIMLPILAGFCCWRAYRLKNKQITSTNIDNLFKWGSCVLTLTIIIFLARFIAHATTISPQIPAWLCTAFFTCVLTARALTNASYMRRFHHAGLWGSAVSQESIIWVSMSVLGLIAILCALLFGTVPAISQASSKRHLRPGGHLVKIPAGLKSQNIPFNWLILVLCILAIAIVLGYLFWRRYRRLQQISWRTKKKDKEMRESEEIHESLFNWSLFLEQLKALLLGLLASLSRKKRGGTNSKQREIDDILLAEPAVRSMREVYRALLKQAASMGHTRAKDETPYEFRERLHAAEPSIAPEIELITEAYVQARYSGKQPGEADISRVRALWTALRDKWAKPIPTQQGR